MVLMLDALFIFRKNGTVLWSKIWEPLKGDPIGGLVHSVLLEHRATDIFTHGDYYSCKWSMDNEMEVVAVAIYQKFLVLDKVDELLAQCKEAFCNLLRSTAAEQRDNVYPCNAFSPKFEVIYSQMEQRAVEERKLKAANKPRSFAESKKFSNTRQGNKESCAVKQPGAATASPSKSGTASNSGKGGEGGEENEEEQDDATQEQIAANIAKMRAGGGPRKKGGGKGEKAKEEEGSEAPRKKEARVWDGEGKTAPKDLDFSKKGDRDTKVRVFKGGKVDLDEQFGKTYDDDDDDDDAEEAAGASSTGSGGKAKGGGLWSSLKGLVGNKPIDSDDLAPLMEKLQGRLVEKNVASDIGQQICDSVGSSLLGKTCAGFGTLRSTVQASMERSLTNILTPSRRVDMLAAAAAAKSEGRPYTVAFVGVNGVGKSTSLSKVAYYLKSNGFTPMLCACDTFRAGAVEQLRVHAQSLELPLFEKGYGRDPSGIATDGIRYAKSVGHDVVLIDTAGRMQDNEPLMRALSKLVTVNNPDLVLFVGEALVGNEAVDQVSGFNQALSEHSASTQPRLIDGIMLTKFDTINDKVGAALSLVYTTGKPVVFVGVGQTYTDIRNLNVDHCVKALLRG